MKREKCAWSDTISGIETPCNKSSVGRSKYCARHRGEAKARWVSMIRAKTAERVEASTPVQTPAGTLYPASYIRARAKGMACVHKLKEYLYGIEVLDGLGARLAITGKDELGTSQTVYELL